MLFVFVYYICFAQIINICIEIFVQLFTHTVQFLIYRCLCVCNVIILVTLPSHHTTLPSHNTAITSHSPSHHTAITPHCHHTTLPSHHTAITTHCHHIKLPSHHTATTPHCHHITLPSQHTAITPHCRHTTQPSHHTTLTHCLTSRYLMRAARLLHAVTRFISGRASMLCCCPFINRSIQFRSWTSTTVKNSVFLRCVTRIFEHSIT